MVPVPKLLLIVCEPGEKALLQQTLAPYAKLDWVSDSQEMAQQLEKADYDVVFLARALFMSQWKEVLGKVREINPNLPVIVLSPTSEPAEWEEVLAAGAFDLLGPPYGKRELLPVVEHAVASYEACAWHSAAKLQMVKAS